MQFKMYRLLRLHSKIGNIIPVRYWFVLAAVALMVNILLLSAFLNKHTLESKPFLRFGTSNELQDELFEFEDEKDDGTLVNMVDFKYLISKSQCDFEISNDEIPYFVIAINSDPLNAEMRKAIRSTWGNSNEYAQIVFFLGKAESENVQTKIQAENEDFGDIIQGNFVDCRHNLTYKHMMMLKWFSETCHTAKYLVKVDDEVFANVPAIYEFLVENKNTTDFLMGDYWPPSPCPRDGPWAVTYEEYAPKYYPAFALRFSIIYSRDVVVKLIKASHFVDFFWVDDVYVTGLLRVQINIDIMPLSNYLLGYVTFENLKKWSACLPHPVNFMFSKQGLTVRDHFLLWERTEWYRLGHSYNQ